MRTWQTTVASSSPASHPTPGGSAAPQAQPHTPWSPRVPAAPWHSGQVQHGHNGVRHVELRTPATMAARTATAPAPAHGGQHRPSCQRHASGSRSLNQCNANATLASHQHHDSTRPVPHRHRHTSAITPAPRQHHHTSPTPMPRHSTPTPPVQGHRQAFYSLVPVSRTKACGQRSGAGPCSPGSPSLGTVSPGPARPWPGRIRPLGISDG